MYPLRKGFTIIELMIVIAIVGLLSAIAYPSYINQIVKSRRAEAQSALLWIAAEQERFFTNNNRYGKLTELGFPGNTFKTEEGHYAVSITALGGFSFTLQAAPQSLPGKQKERDTICQILTLDNLGNKGSEEGTTQNAIKDCW